MAEKKDILGRRIPEFDRSAAGKKANQTMKDKHGTTIQSKFGRRGGRLRTRGYFGHLKDTGEIEKLKAISHTGAEKSNAVQAKKRMDTN